ncbi:MAG: type IV pilin, partial [Thermoplasmatota archaeon]
MKRGLTLGSRKHPRDGPSLLGVSEVVGTILLLGISVVMVGGIALWTSQLEEKDEGLFVDLWSQVDGNTLTIVHRGGDLLVGSDTEITVYDSDGEEFFNGNYYDPAKEWTDYWDPSEEFEVSLTLLPSGMFTLVVTTVKDNGVSTVVLRNEMVKGMDTSGLPDLAVTRIWFTEKGGATANFIEEVGVYIVNMEISNFGTGIEEVYFKDNLDGTVSNLVVYDSENELYVTKIVLQHYKSDGATIISPEDIENWGKLQNGEKMRIEMTWGDPTLMGGTRTLGIHELGVKVIPHPAGELDYRNNVVRRKFQVEKKLLQIVPEGPDPGIYDIYFSSSNPKSGEKVKVTVIVQNSGSLPLLPSHGVNLVVSLDKIIKKFDGIDPYLDWVQDYPDHEGKLRTEDSTYTLVNDNLFPTCVVTDLSILPGSYQFFYFDLEAHVDVPGDVRWVYAGIDVYDSPGSIEHLKFEDGDYFNDNYFQTFIQVLPRILLVDDDEATAGTDQDMTTHVIESLVGAGIELDTVFVADAVNDLSGQRDAPAFTYEMEESPYPAMEDYDIVVWVTGNVDDPLTNVPEIDPSPYTGNIQQLMDYMDSYRYLLIVGTDPFGGLMDLFGADGVTTNKLVENDATGDASDFLYKYLGLHQVTANVDIPDEDPTSLFSMDVYVDLVASIQQEGDTDWSLVVSHEGGDELTGSTTTINIYDQNGDLVVGSSGTFEELSSLSVWASGTDLEIDISGFTLSVIYEIEITTTTGPGGPIIIYTNRMIMPDAIDEQPLLELSGLYHGGIFSKDFSLVLMDQTSANGKMSLFAPRTVYEEDKFEVPVGILTTKVESEKPAPVYNSVRTSGTPDPTLFGAAYRSAVIAWDITQMRYLNEKISLFADIMKWFDWEIKVGKDLAITKMDMFVLQKENDVWLRSKITEENVPKYLDTVEIEVTVRNNGPNVESPILIFYVTGPNGIEEYIPSNIPDPRSPDDQVPAGRGPDRNPVEVVSIPGRGGEVKIYKLWLAVGAGIFKFRVMVDPYLLISEISEDNNDISYSTTTLSSFVAENNILIVDDDGSENNFVSEDIPKGITDKVIINYANVGQEEPSQVVMDILVDLDYDFEVETTVNRYSITGSEWVMGSGPGEDILKRYNSVIWVTGRSGSIEFLARETLTDEDMVSIMNYLNGIYGEAELLPPDHHENMMFIGSHLVPDITGIGSIDITGSSPLTTTYGFLVEYLGVNPSTSIMSNGDDVFGPTEGRFLSDAFLGLDILGTDITGSSYQYAPLTLSDRLDSDTRCALSTSTAEGLEDIIGVQQHRMTDNGDQVNYFRTLLHAWEPTKVVHSSEDVTVTEFPFHELMFLGLHWFQTPENDPELVSRGVLITVNDDNPEVGSSYIVTVEVANLGGDSAGGTVRFMDSGTIFRSSYIYLDPGDEITLEALWEPHYAGTREITVWLDRFDDSDEIFNTLNNIPSRMIYVYYLRDDLEEGWEQWKHDANLVYINGESPLDYYDPSGIDPDTNVIGDWDWGMSSGTVATETTYHSSPRSFHLKEEKGEVEGEADVIISFVIDDSASMEMRKSLKDPTKSWLDVAKNAALVLLNELSNDSVVVSIWDFQGNMERRFSGPTDRGTSEGGIPTKIRRDPVRVGDDFGGVSGRERIRAEIEAMRNDAGTTIIWDCIGEAYLDTLYWSTYYPDLDPVVIVLSDGMDLQASDKSGLSILTADQKAEAGSTYWAPWGSMADGEQYFKDHVGKYTLNWALPDSNTYWMYTLATGSVDRYRYGLLYSDIPIYTIGLGLEHHDPPYLPETTTNPLSGYGDHHPDYTYAVCTGSGCLESGTLEYNLWRIADTSDAQYFYAPSAEELEDIFRELGKLLAKPQAQSRSGEPGRGDVVNPNSNKWVVTPEIDLTSSAGSKLSFWHKYNVVDGANGAYILIGYRDPAVDTDGDGFTDDDWDWRYATPEKGFYSGSLMPNVDRPDSFGNFIKWGWTGISGVGTFAWEHVELNILDFVPAEHRSAVKVRFQYTQYGGGTGLGW